MKWLLISAVYLVLAAVTARAVFVSYIDRYGRNAAYSHDRYGSRYGKGRDPFAAPFWAGVLWPITVLACAADWCWRHAITRPTPAERKRQEQERRRQELERVAAEVRKIGKEYDLPVVGYVADGQMRINVDGQGDPR